MTTPGPPPRAPDPWRYALGTVLRPGQVPLPGPPTAWVVVAQRLTLWATGRVLREYGVCLTGVERGVLRWVEEGEIREGGTL